MTTEGTKHRCRWCREIVTLYLGSWWTADDECDCPAGEGEHLPYLVTEIPDQEAWTTLPQMDRYWKNDRRMSGARHHSGKPSKMGRPSYWK